MKTVITIIGIWVLSMAIWAFWLFGYTGGRITQKADNFDNEPVIATLVWYEGAIIESWYDPISKMSKQDIENRKEQAENLLNIVKNIE